MKNWISKQAVWGGILVFVLLGISFFIFNSLSVSAARRFDIEWGYYFVLFTFIVLLIGIIVNGKDLIFRVWEKRPPLRISVLFILLVVFFSVFAVRNISNTHRVLSDETSWESMGLQMYYSQSGGVCNEGFWTKEGLNCLTEVNNFKGKALSFLYSLVFIFAEPNRDTALSVNLPLYVLSLMAFFFAFSIWFKSPPLSFAATAFLGGMPIFLMQARSASTEVLYIFLLSVLMAWFALIPPKEIRWKHFLLTVPLIGFFAQTRQETIFALIPFALYYHSYFREKFYRLPLFVLSVIAVCLPSINTMAAYRGYDFQGGSHKAHSLENLWYNLKTNIEVMLNFSPDSLNGGLLKNPFYTTFTVILLFSCIWLLVRLIVNRRYVRGAVLACFFSLQILVILLNVSGTFQIEINQRYVLVALPLFAVIMALGLKDFLETVFFKKEKAKWAARITVLVAVGLAVCLALFHQKSFQKNMLYYRNKLLAEENFLNDKLSAFPENSIFIYARPWQMLASGHSSLSERSFLGWDFDDFSNYKRNSNDNIYLVRGQDGYGSVNRNSRVVGFKTTSSIEQIFESYKTERVLVENQLFGYPLTIHRILGKKDQSANLVSVSEVQSNGVVIIENQNADSIHVQIELNLKPYDEFSFNAKTDTLHLDLEKFQDGMNEICFVFIAKGDSTVIFRDYFQETPSAVLLTSIPVRRASQDWGSLQIGRSVENNKMRIDSRAYRYGLGTHAASRVAYDLNGNYETLFAVIGLDDESSCGDGAYFRILGDDRELFSSKMIFSLEKESVEVSLQGVNRLELITLGGSNIDCDHTNWVNIWLKRNFDK